MSRSVATGVLVVALLLGAAAPASAIERFVRPDGDPTCLSTANCHLTVQAAADAAGDGDVITIGHNGGASYAENVDFGGRANVTFRGQAGARPTIAAIAANDDAALFVAAGANGTAITHLAFSGSADDSAIDLRAEHDRPADLRHVRALQRRGRVPAVGGPVAERRRHDRREPRRRRRPDPAAPGRHPAAHDDHGRPELDRRAVAAVSGGGARVLGDLADDRPAADRSCGHGQPHRRQRQRRPRRPGAGQLRDVVVLELARHDRCRRRRRARPAGIDRDDAAQRDDRGPRARGRAPHVRAGHRPVHGDEHRAARSPGRHLRRPGIDRDPGARDQHLRAERPRRRQRRRADQRRRQRQRRSALRRPGRLPRPRRLAAASTRARQCRPATSTSTASRARAARRPTSAPTSCRSPSRPRRHRRHHHHPQRTWRRLRRRRRRRRRLRRRLRRPRPGCCRCPSSPRRSARPRADRA